MGDALGHSRIVAQIPRRQQLGVRHIMHVDHHEGRPRRPPKVGHVDLVVPDSKLVGDGRAEVVGPHPDRVAAIAWRHLIDFQQVWPRGIAEYCVIAEGHDHEHPRCLAPLHLRLSRPGRSGEDVHQLRICRIGDADDRKPGEWVGSAVERRHVGAVIDPAEVPIQAPIQDRVMSNEAHIQGVRQ